MIPPTVSFKSGVTVLTFRVLSSAAGVAGSLMYVVSSVSSSAGSSVDYGLQVKSGGSRYVVDASGVPINITLSTLCPIGSYPGLPSTISTSSGDSAVTRSCISCPSLTSTYVAVTSSSR